MHPGEKGNVTAPENEGEPPVDPGAAPRPRLRQRLGFRRRQIATLARTSRTVLRTQGLMQLLRFALRWLRRPRAPIPVSFETGGAPPPPLQRRVAVIVPTYRQTTLVSDCVQSVRASLGAGSRGRVRIIVVDDGSGASVRSALLALPAEVLLQEENRGFAHAVNAGLARLEPGEDALILNNDTLAHRGCIERLQAAALAEPEIGIVGAKLLYPDGRIQSAGTYRSVGETSRWFDHCHRFMPADHPPANIPRDVLAVTGACMYVRHEVLDAIGPLDPIFPMAFEDVDYCLRARLAGFRVSYEPSAVLVHLEGHTRGERKEARELDSQTRFWERWERHFDGRDVRSGSTGGLKVIYVLLDTGVAGGHRVAFEQMNRLADRGHEVELFSLAGRPKWFPLRVPVRTFRSRQALCESLSEEPALKVATWWETGELVWKASLLSGIPVFLVQDVETSYFGAEGDASTRAQVLASYRKEFHYLTDATWTQARLRELGIGARVVSPGVDRDIFATASVSRERDVLLSLGRSHPLKNLDLLRRALGHLQEPVSVWLFGVEPQAGEGLGARYHYCPDDREVASLYQRATVFVLTSRHEGFGLPILEAMACGCPVVCTDADGNMDFCRDGENCLIVSRDDERALARAVETLIRSPELRERLRLGGLETAERYDWNRAVDGLEAFLGELARARSEGVRGPVGRTAGGV